MRRRGPSAGSAPAEERVPADQDDEELPPPASLTEAQLLHLREHGFLRLDRVATTAETSHIRGVVEKLFAARAGYEEGAHFNFAGADDDPAAPSFPQIIAPHNYAASLRRTDYYKRASAIARQILGPEARFGGDHTLLKPALNGPVTPWHQDEAFRNPNSEYREISIWMPLQPVNEVNGCMQFIPGTHRGPILPHRSQNNDPRAHALEACEGVDLAAAVSCPLPAGGCTIHTGRTLHAAGPNRSTAPRLAYVLNFVIPPVPALSPRSFPWLEEKETARLKRMRVWMRRGGVFVETWRLVKRTEPRDYGRLLSELMRKASRLRTLCSRRKAAEQ